MTGIWPEKRVLLTILSVDKYVIRPLLSGLFCFADWSFPDKSADISDGLFEPLLIFNKGYANVTFAVFAEGPARRDCHLGVFHKVHCIVDSALAFEMLLWDFCPDEHTAAGFRDLPADAG